MFKFYFDVKDSESTPELKKADATGKTMSIIKVFDLTPFEKDCSEEVSGHASKKVILTNKVAKKYELFKLNSSELSVNDVTLYYVVSRYLLQTLSSEDEEVPDIKKAEEARSDIIPGVYEGIFKLNFSLYFLSLSLFQEELKFGNALATCYFIYLKT